MEKTKLTAGIFILLLIGIFVTAKTIDTSIDFDTKQKDKLKEIGIENPIINPCIQIDEFYCKANVYEKDGINKDIKIEFKYCIEYEINKSNGECSEWKDENQTECLTYEIINTTTTNCLKYKTLTQLEIESEMKNQTEILLNKIADIQISRNQTKEVLTDGILIGIEEKK